MRRLKVLFITAWYPSPANPVDGVFVREHARAVARRHDITVLHCVEPTDEEPLAGRVEREVDPAGPGEPPVYRLHRRRPRMRGTGLPAAVLATGRAVRRIARDGFSPDIVHAHVYAAGAPAVAVSRWLGVPLVVTEHFSLVARGRLTPDERRNARIAYRGADVVLPVSHLLRDAIEALGVETPLVVVPNVVDSALFFPPQSALRRVPTGPARLLTVGTMPDTHVKGIPVLLEALERLPPGAGSWELDVIGDGPARAEYERRAAVPALAGRVRFHGLRPKVEVADFMRRADLFVLASAWETFGCVVLEALASGLPVVATAVGAIPDLVSPEDGKVVPPGNPEALATALAEVLAARARYDAAAIAGRARRFAPEPVGEMIDRVYRQLVPA